VLYKATARFNIGKIDKVTTPKKNPLLDSQRSPLFIVKNLIGLLNELGF